LATTACTRRPVEKIIPYANKPENVTPGVANWYASSCGECSSGCGVLVKTREGRPIKLEGNPDHALTQGGLCATGQASVLNLYDPDRLTAPQTVSGGATTAGSWDEIDAQIIGKLKSVKNQGGRVRLLTGELTGSTLKLIEDFGRQFSDFKHVTYDVMSEDETATAQDLAYGAGRVMPRYAFDKAKVIVTFGADFLGNWGNQVENSKSFSKGRKGTHGHVTRLYAFESIMTLTGSNSDLRHPVAPGDQLKVALAIANEVIMGGGTRLSGDSAVTGLIGKYNAGSVSQETGVPAALIQRAAKDLKEARGAGIVLGGGHTARGNLGVALDVVASLLNSALDNDGATIDGTSNNGVVLSSAAALEDLRKDLDAGRVDALILHRANPVAALASLGINVDKAKLVVSTSRHADETALKAQFICPDHHDLENWGDAHPGRGIWSIRQPTISPLHKTRAFEDSLIAWGKGLGGTFAASWYDYVRTQWQGVQREVGEGGSFGAFWEEVLRRGVVYNKSALNGGRARSFRSAALASAVSAVGAAPAGLKLVVFPNTAMGDGRNSNNSWLQEFPEPVSRTTWGNVVALAPATAAKMSVKDGDIVRVKAGDTTIELAAQVQPGQHADTVAIALGYGRTAAGRVGNGVGVNASQFLRWQSGRIAYGGESATVSKTGGFRKLACTQTHHSMEGRDIIREEKLHGDHGHKHEGHHLVTLWPEHKYEGYRWGMAIDLNACTGCGACVIGCQAENNIPVVGYKDITNGREMHWMRIDRYYSGTAENPDTAYQPMLCQHCENAPCETVCPVIATSHDDEGINQQTYNRCVGTRYCANNCPYKVRRFNWFTYTDVATPLHMAYNPDVTVRTRGVMEKCNFCTQRVREAKHKAKDLNRRVLDGEIQTACQQSCPTDAITFGDINDKNSKVSKLSHDKRAYHVLEEINVRPSISYLNKIRNS
jgi:molybdopterin-containing oxidoreductase family iron-sulfur binding subunit